MQQSIADTHLQSPIRVIEHNLHVCLRSRAPRAFMEQLPAVFLPQVRESVAENELHGCDEWFIHWAMDTIAL